MKRELLVVGDRRGGGQQTYELLFGERVSVSADEEADVHVAFADFELTVANREDGGWRLEMNGTVRGPLGVDPHVAAWGRFSVVSFEAAPFDDVMLATSWALFGRRRPWSRGRWPAVRVRDGVVERALAIVHRGRALDAAPLRAPHDVVTMDDVTIEMFPACDGVTVRELFREIDAGALEPGLAQRIFAPVAAMAQRVPNHLNDVVITFDGDVRMIERPSQGGSIDDSIEAAVGPYLRYGDPSARALERAELAEIARGCAADKWRDEREVREQLAMLDDESARAFFADAAQRTLLRASAPHEH